jgi:hypothetical protein
MIQGMLGGTLSRYLTLPAHLPICPSAPRLSIYKLIENRLKSLAREEGEMGRFRGGRQFSWRQMSDEWGIRRIAPLARASDAEQL